MNLLRHFANIIFFFSYIIKLTTVIILYTIHVLLFLVLAIEKCRESSKLINNNQLMICDAIISMDNRIAR